MMLFLAIWVLAVFAMALAIAKPYAFGKFCGSLVYMLRHPVYFFRYKMWQSEERYFARWNKTTRGKSDHHQ